MDSLEEFDLPRELNFRSSRRFLSLAEEDLASLVLRARRGTAESQETTRFLLSFPPLQPRFAQLLHALLVRFDLAFAVQGWGDERRVVAEATARKGLIPVLRCEDFLVGEAAREGLQMLGPSELEAPKEAQKGSEEEYQPQHDDREEAAPATPVKRKRLGGMRGWSSEEEAEEGRGKAGKLARGRGFAAEPVVKADEELVLRCRLRNDYEPYAIDPEDTWRPHRKPYVELLEAWEFSHAWSFEPEQNPNRPPASKEDPGGVASWRVEHVEQRHFAVALGGQSHDMRRWLSGREGSSEEPYVLEFRILEMEQQQWEFRFSRCSQLRDATWRPLPWSCERHSVFWMACFVPEGKNYLHLGLENFPEKRFFSARLARFPRAVGFGPSKDRRSFFIRDIVFFGRGALKGTPYAGRDHIVEAQLSSRKVDAALRKAKLEVKEVLALGPEEKGEEKENLPSKTPWRKMFSDGILEGDRHQEASKPSEAISLILCSSPEKAVEVAKVLSARVVPGICRTWPLGNDLLGPEAAKQAAEIQAEEWRRLHPETVRELGFFKEHLERNTKHLEGTRIARSAAMRMIISGLSGPAPTPAPPTAGV